MSIYHRKNEVLLEHCSGTQLFCFRYILHIKGILHLQCFSVSTVHSCCVCSHCCVLLRRYAPSTYTSPLKRTFFSSRKYFCCVVIKYYLTVLLDSRMSSPGSVSCIALTALRIQSYRLLHSVISCNFLELTSHSYPCTSSSLPSLNPVHPPLSLSFLPLSPFKSILISLSPLPLPSFPPSYQASR